MRILMTTTRGEGHLRPLLPFADAFRDQGHDVLIAAPESTTEAVLDAGHEAWALPQAPAAVSDAVSARAHAAEPEEANRIVIGELFAGVQARAALPGVMGAVAEWRPDARVTLTPPALDGGVTEGHYREPAAPLEAPPLRAARGGRGDRRRARRRRRHLSLNARMRSS
jgi:UDP:flavonoid glycosyltransferase YjiC (YdhE family)